MSEPKIYDLRSSDGRRARDKAMRLLAARIGHGRQYPGGQEVYNEAFTDLGLTGDYEAHMLVAAQVEITHLLLLWITSEDLADVDLADFRGRDPAEVLLLLDRFFDDAQATD